MSIDIRIKTTFKDHRKRKKLAARLGPAGVLALIDLWLTTAETHPTGVLDGYTAEDIEIDAGWTGERGAFAKAAAECGFLELTSSGYALHDWPDHQQYIIHAPERAALAKRAAGMRWASRLHAARMPTACAENADVMPLGNAPSPTPSPTPIPDTPNPPQGAMDQPDMTGWEGLVSPANIVRYVRNLTTADPSAAMLACWKAAMTELATRKADPEAVGLALDAFAKADPKFRGTLPDARRLKADWFLGLVTKYGGAK